MEERFGLYECMFLASQATAADFTGLIEHINYLLGRANAETIAMRKWDERRLAFPIEKQKRGVYILVYIRAPREMITKLERDVTISDKIMRMLVIRADHLSLEEMKAQDGREALETEGKLRATQDEETTKKADTVHAGAPKKSELLEPGDDKAPEPNDAEKASEAEPAAEAAAATTATTGESGES